MAASGLDVAVGCEWTPFARGFVFWEYPGEQHLPPPDEAGRREWLEGFLQAHADYPDKPFDPDNPASGKSVVQGETSNAFKVVEILLNSKRTVRRKILQLNARD